MDKMISKMSKMYPMMVAMGVMIVAIALIVGFVNSQTADDYYSHTKVDRETNLTDDRASMESVALWLPYFKFFGVGLVLGGIIMALRRIIDNLRDVGEEVLTNLDPKDRPELPSPPWFAMLMPLLMMIGELIFIYALIVSIGLAATARNDVFNHPLSEIDSAGAGSKLLSDLQHIKSTNAYLVPLKFFAIATEFLAIAIGLATIIYILTEQTKVLDKALNIAKGANN